eukprot:Opistho-2@21625
MNTGIKLRRRVYFADSIGLSLTKCKEFGRSDRPVSISSDENASDDDEPLSDAPAPSPKNTVAAPSLRKFLSPTFQQPACTLNFYQRVAKHHVSLENVITRESHLIGTVIVENLAFEKSVFVRYTSDGWKTHAEVAATHAMSVRGGAFDRFSFLCQVPDDFPAGGLAEFAVRYEVGGQTYWDNNGGINYKVQCFSYSSTFTSFLELEQQLVREPPRSATVDALLFEPPRTYPRLPRAEQIIISI